MSNLVLYARSLPLVTKVASAIYFTLSAAAILLRLRAGTEPSSDDPIHLASLDPARFLVLRPGFVISYPWTLVTSAFVEPNPLLLLCDLAALVTVGSFLERQWGPRSYALFFLVTSAIPALTSVLAVIVMYAIRSNSALLYSTQIVGLPAVLSGFAVGLKQIIPDYNIKLFRGAVSFRMNDLPGLYTLVTPIMFVLLGSLGGVLLVNIGFFEAFIYLRFYKQDGPVRGDRSEAFAFATFFPELVQPLIKRLSAGVYNLAVACKLITSDEGYQQQTMAGHEEGLGAGYQTEPPVGTEESDADRRRALAAKALEMRLGSSGSAQSGPAGPAGAGAGLDQAAGESKQ